MSRAKTKVTIQLPEEFLELCNYDMVCPARILRGFIADLCGIINWASSPRTDRYSCSGSDEREFARQYYDRVGYPYEAQWLRDDVGQGKAPCSQAANSNCHCRIKGLTPAMTSSIVKRGLVNVVRISEAALTDLAVHYE